MTLPVDVPVRHVVGEDAYNRKTCHTLPEGT